MEERGIGGESAGPDGDGEYDTYCGSEHHHDSQCHGEPCWIPLQSSLERSEETLLPTTGVHGMRITVLAETAHITPLHHVPLPSPQNRARVLLRRCRLR